MEKLYEAMKTIKEYCHGQGSSCEDCALNSPTPNKCYVTKGGIPGNWELNKPSVKVVK